MAQEPKSLPPTATGPNPAFDPYYQWLGIPPREQPPTYYRLLGLSLYESNHEVIAFAAERQIAHVRMFQAGPHSVASQKLLNELAAAELCLTTPHRKAAYDEELRAALAPAVPPVINTPAMSSNNPPSLSGTAALPNLKLPPAPVPSPAPTNGNGARAPDWVSGLLPPTAVMPAPVAQPPNATQQKSLDSWSRTKIGVIAGCVVAGVVLVWLSVHLLQRRDEPNQPSPGQIANDPPDEKRLPAPEGSLPPKNPVETDHAAPPPFPVPKDDPANGSTPPNRSGTEPPDGPKKSPSRPVNSGVTKTETPKTDPPPKVDTPPDPKPEVPVTATVSTQTPEQLAASQRLSPPTSLDQRRAKELLEQVWAGQIAAAVSPAAKTAMAEQLLKKMDDLQAAPTERFVMLDKSEELAIAAGNLRLALSVINQQAREFNIDAAAARADLLQSIQGKLATPDANREFVAAGLDLSDEAFDAKNYSLAAKIADMALTTARKIGNAELIKTLNARTELIQDALQKAQRIADARQVLASQPRDPAANLLLGEYLCLEENDWDHGLTNLAESGEADLTELAHADLAHPTVVEDQLELAERWWSCRYGATADTASPYRARAMFWYRAALPVVSGLNKAKVELRIQELERLGSATQPPLASGTFNAQAAHELQRRWAKTLKSTPVKTNSLSMTLVLVPAGEFRMGAVMQDMQAAQDEQPTHAVRLTRPLYLAADEVTVEQFTAFVTATGYQTDREQGKGNSIYPAREQDLESAVRDQERKLGNQSKGGKGRGPGGGGKFMSTWRTPLFVQANNSPVVYVSWNDAVEFCKWLSKKERAKYRLPTEAEWEFACRAGTASIYFNGDQPDDLTRIGNLADSVGKQFPKWTATVKMSDGFAYTSPVGHFPSNSFGLHDMHGNVAEWCADRYAAEYYRDSPAENPTGPKKSDERAFRGGGWCDYAVDCRASARGHAAAGDHGIYVGFRVACEP